MAKGYVLKDTFTKETLMAVALMGVIFVAPGASGYFLKEISGRYFNDKQKKKIYARSRKLRELEKRKLLEFKELSNGMVKIELTHKGKRLNRMYNLENIKLKRPVKWDGKWRVIMYDIPSFFRKASNAFSKKLKEMGLYPLQKSVWISPFDCLEELEFIATVFDLEIDRHIQYILAVKIPNEDEIRKFFDL